MTHKPLIDSQPAPQAHQFVDAAGLPDLATCSASNAAEASHCATDCDIILGDPSLVCQVLPRMSRLVWVQSTWAGVEPLVDPAQRHDYLLTAACDVFGGQMSEYVFGYLLAHERLILQKHASQQAGSWDKTPPGTLHGKTMGLLGVGSIGAALARTAKHFGM